MCKIFISHLYQCYLLFQHTCIGQLYLFVEIHILPILSAIIALLVVAMAVLCLLYQKGIVCCKRVSSSKFQDSERELSTSANSGTNSSGYSNSSYNDNDLNTLLDLSNQTLLCHGNCQLELLILLVVGLFLMGLLETNH